MRGRRNPPKTCPRCGLVFSGRNQFCSPRCAKAGDAARKRGKSLPLAVKAKQSATHKQRASEDPAIVEKMIVGHALAPHTGKFPTHKDAKEWSLRSPEGEVFLFRNLRHFIREHPEFFGASELDFSRAKSGLGKLRPSRKYGLTTWKEWSWAR